ncbi:unnamed protein product [Pleuronectes platessa]|uniref:UDP-glucuronosyltransferase n=1 Tax=Pleuronectes platessa TaxID=8262 RepID=A0A9N7TYC3_PLEPL|nr:unnamed protein product [Pleuronectes platessa]
MSLGTFVSELPAYVTNKMAAAFAKLPQKVIWSYKGDRPATLANNTLLVDWMPQNDLLGHPKIKLFVAHGGTNGVQEAIYHGVPVVGLPLFFDQKDNLLRLKERGGAKILTLATVDKDNNFRAAIQEVLTEPSYRLNMQRLSRLHRDQPMKPLDTAIFWIEFVMRHKAADLWLMRVDFVFEFPRPTMPNVVYMGGFQCKPAKPLPQHLEDFVQSSGEHGVIIMSLGTFISTLPQDLADEIATAFAKLPQKVIWRLQWFSYHTVDVMLLSLELVLMMHFCGLNEVFKL